MRTALVPAVLAVLALTACGGPEGEDDFAADESEVRIDYTYDCTRLAQGRSDPHAGEKLFVHVTADKAATGPTAQVDVTNGWAYDRHYTSTDAVPYVRYADPANTTRTKRYLKVQKPMRASGGMTMNNGSKGGYAIVETTAGTYSWAKYLCFRVTGQPTTGPGTAYIRYVAQFVGTYTGRAPVTKLTIKRDGTYEATISGKAETGSVSSPGSLAAAQASTALFALRSSTGTTWTANPVGYTRTLDVVRGTTHETLTATTPVGPDESLCDDSGGSWTDDDVDAATGLYCVCPGAKWYLPSAGGCVN